MGQTDDKDYVNRKINITHPNMKNKNICIAILACLLVSSCEKLVLSEEDSIPPLVESESNSVLNIRTRGASVLNEDAGEEEPAVQEKVSYPVRVFAFDSQSQCVGVKDIASADDDIQFKLPEGNYRIYAVGLDQGERYTLPDVSAVKPESKLVLKDDFGHGDLMTASANAALSEDETNILTLQMERKVLKVDDVTMKNIPDNVTKVAVTILPLGENLQVNGEIDGTNGAQSILLSKDEASRTWSNTESCYLLASNSQATVKVSLTYDTGKALAFSYVSNEKLEANYIVNISGEFKADEVSLSGTIKGVSWAGTKDISFQIKEKDGEVSNVPAVGTLYSGCYVLKHDTYGKQIVVTLMSVDEKANMDFDDDEDQASLETVIENGLKEMSPEGITLRLSNTEERAYIRENIADINQRLEALGKTPVTANSFVTGSDGSKTYSHDDGYYYRRPSTGKLAVYFFGDNKSNANILKKNTKGYRLRGFATKTF